MCDIIILTHCTAYIVECECNKKSTILTTEKTLQSSNNKAQDSHNNDIRYEYADKSSDVAGNNEIAACFGAEIIPLGIKSFHLHAHTINTVDNSTKDLQTVQAD